ncbi:MAG: MFS transporter [Phycisphaerales bacterium]
MAKYRTTPPQISGFPRGIPYIIGNELAERFSFYGMKGILTVFMTKHLLDASGAASFMSDEDAKATYHLFTAAAYFFPIIGSLLSDIFWGKYKTIIILSLGYCIGHLCLAIMDLGPITGAFDMKPWLFMGLLFIAIGAGGIKPCVSAHVGDQFGKSNQHLVSKMFSWFYFAINVGAMTSTLLTPVLLAKVGPWAAFGLPGVLMAIATFVFWLGRHKFVHVPAAGWKKFKEETFSRDGMRAVLNLAPIFLIFIPVFWALFDQTGSAWVIQAQSMDRHFLGVEWYESQVQAVNPFLILVLIPLFAYVVYPAMDKVFPMTPLRKIALGLFLTAAAFCVPSLIQQNISGGEAKSTTVTTMETLQPVGLIDGETQGPGWSSATAPTAEVTQEIIIRLRERSAWNIGSIEIDPTTEISTDEVFLTLAHLRQKVKGEAETTNDYTSLEALDAAIGRLEGVGENGAASLIAAGVRELSQLGYDATILDFDSYLPGSISLYTGDFSQGAVPSLRSTLEAERAGITKQLANASGNQSELNTRLREVENALKSVDEFHAQAGWQRVGEVTFGRGDTAAKTVSFDPQKATHALIRINSNLGGPRVKLSEVRINTTDALPADPARGASDAWPNVAALGYKPSIAWQFLAYLLLTAAEVLVSITSLEFAYTQAPRKMKSFIMGIYFLGVSLGNFFAAGVNLFIQNKDGTTKLEGASYYWFFTILMLVTAVIFVIYSQFYRGQRYVQGDDGDDPDSSSPDSAEIDAAMTDPQRAGFEGND